MSPSDLQGLATRWLANLPGRDSHPLDYMTLPGRTSMVSPELPTEEYRSYSTLTLDNGTENARHSEITEAIGAKCYFAHPYSSWERGTNENINGLIRWYLPKGTDFSKVTEDEIARIERLINNRPRKCLGFKTPYEIASSHGVALRG